MKFAVQKGREMSNLTGAAVAQAQNLTGRRDRLLAGYLLNRKRGASAVRNMIREDMRRFCDLGAKGYASDLAEVLKCFDATIAEKPYEAA
jgi:hypothetical protein